jgi:hypothetical protein
VVSSAIFSPRPRPGYGRSENLQGCLQVTLDAAGHPSIERVADDASTSGER